MFETTFPLTLNMAVGLGVILLAAGIGGLSGPPGAVSDWEKTIDEMRRLPGLTLAMAFIAIMFGAGILFVHPYHGDPLAIIVTVIGWMSFLEGLLLLAVPRLYLSFARWGVRYARAWAIGAIVLGLALFLAGLTGRVTNIL